MLKSVRPGWHACTQILEEKHQLSFHLQQQRLIELIRVGKTEEALEFAQEYLAPRGEENPAFLEELGRLAVRPLLVCAQHRKDLQASPGPRRRAPCLAEVQMMMPRCKVPWRAHLP